MTFTMFTTFTREVHSSEYIADRKRFMLIRQQNGLLYYSRDQGYPFVKCVSINSDIFAR